MEVLSSDNETDVSVLRASHRIRCDNAAVLARYTDILLLLIAHYISPSIPSPKLWIMSDIGKKKALKTSGQSTALLPFHTLTG